MEGRREAYSPSPCCTSGHNQKNQPESGWLTRRSELLYLHRSPRKQGEFGERCPIVWIGTLRL